jgi:glycosyltransferase involved in cell wall biosynthesis
VTSRKLILYQGHIDLRERNLIPLLRSSLEWPESWRLVLMGHDHGSLDTCLRLAPQTTYFPFQDPPTHLLVTRLADVGVCCYEYDSLNSAFCAPNKVWEYSACSLPILANDVPGLVDIEECGAGLCVSFDEPKAITVALKAILHDEQRYRAGSQALFASCDMVVALGGILDGLRREAPSRSASDSAPEPARSIRIR